MCKDGMAKRGIIQMKTYQLENNTLPLRFKFDVFLFISVTIDFQPKIIHLNDTINLTCTVDDKESFGYARQWSKEHHIICFNGFTIDTAKYKEIQTSENQFTLQIRNVSASDVNSMYQCRFGFKESSTTTSTLKDHFECKLIEFNRLFR